MPRIQVSSAEIYRTQRGQGDCAVLVDGAGNTFIGVREITGNDTDYYVRKHAPDGSLVGEWDVQGANGWKIDSGDLGASGDHLLVSTASHDLPPDPTGRYSAAGLAHIPGVFVPFTNQLPEGGAAGAFSPEGEPQPAPEVEVDYDRIKRETEAVVNFVVERIIGADQQNSLINRITTGPTISVRQALRGLQKDAAIQLLTGTDAQAEQYKDALFDFVKNANAGVQANILGGQDEWGVERRNELKAAVREVMEEIGIGQPEA